MRSAPSASPVRIARTANLTLDEFDWIERKADKVIADG